MKNKVTTQNFLSWYFSEPDDVLLIGCKVINSLKIEGSFSINVKELFDSCGYIPEFICEEDSGTLKEYEPKDIELIN